MIWVRSRRCGCLVTWFCYHLIAKPGNKTAAPSWPDPYVHVFLIVTLSGFYSYSSALLYWHWGNHVTYHSQIWHMSLQRYGILDNVLGFDIIFVLFFKFESSNLCSFLCSWLTLYPALVVKCVSVFYHQSYYYCWLIPLYLHYHKQAK